MVFLSKVQKNRWFNNNLYWNRFCWNKIKDKYMQASRAYILTILCERTDINYLQKSHFQKVY